MKFGAINLMPEQYESEILKPELRPAYIEKAFKIQKRKPIVVGTIRTLRKRYEN
ncbi:DUF2683 family protein [Candidatus Woesearchaeota archaeon]|nr:DUF2683 family protein [Candidatus Woesearchaeota archaeon]